MESRKVFIRSSHFLDFRLLSFHFLCVSETTSICRFALWLRIPAKFFFQQFLQQISRKTSPLVLGVENTRLLAFGIVFLIDFAKGILAVGLVRYLDFGSTSVAIAAVAVVAGHIWPAQLRFQGGNGAATGLGALAVLDYNLIILLILFTVVLLLLFRNFTLAGLVALLLTPISAGILYQSVVETTGVAALAALVLFAHRENIRELFANLRARAGKASD